MSRTEAYAKQYEMWDEMRDEMRNKMWDISNARTLPGGASLY